MSTDVAVCSPDSAGNQGSHFPQCRVCGGTASGFHYGANTCEACKVFFMRSLKYKHKYKCSKDKICPIQPEKRTCVFCRFRRCLSIGMSKNASKIGRYTLHRRCLNKEELVKHSSLVKLDYKPNLSVDQLYERLATCLSESSKIHDIFSTVTADGTTLMKAQVDFLEWCSGCTRRIGKFMPLTDAEYDDIHRITGLELNWRHDIVMTSAILLQTGIEKQVKFAKTIPGFKKLCLSDQAQIIRASAGDFSQLCMARCLNNDIGVGTINDGSNFAITDITSVVDESFLRQSFALAGRIAKLKLLGEELAILKSVCITFTDRVNLKDKSAVDEIQWNLIGCLCWLLKRNHGNHELLFYRIWNCILVLRELNEGFSRHIENIQTQLPEDTDASLLREFTAS